MHEGPGILTEPEPSSSPGSLPTRLRRRATLFVIVLAWLFVLMPFLFWRSTWFGRPLTDQEISKYLTDSEHPRKSQHALAQIAERIARGDSSAKRWYPQVEQLAASPLAELRLTAAWVMGQDNREETFHKGLLRLLDDAEPMVRRNAALSLVRFGDATGRPELRAMLQPYTIRTPRAGTLNIRLKESDQVNRGTLLARIQRGAGEPYEVRAELPGRLETKLVAEGTSVERGDAILLLSPAPEQVWEALRALYLVGQAEDLADVERFARPQPKMPEKVREQAELTLRAIRARSADGIQRQSKPGG